MKEARLTDKDILLLKYLSERKGDPADKWDTYYSRYSIRQIEKNLKLGRTAFYLRAGKLTRMGLIEIDKLRVLNKGGKNPVITYRLTEEGKKLMGVK